MKQFKLFLLMFAAAVCLCNFTSCKKDDDAKIDQAIVGTWVCAAQYETITMVLNANGQFTETITHSGSMGSNLESYSGTYTYDGSMLTQYYSDGDVYAAPARVSGNTLYYDELTYTRQ